MLTKILTSSLLFLVAIGGFFVSVRLDESVENKNIISSVSIEVSQTYAATGETQTELGKGAETVLNGFVLAWNTALQAITIVIPVFVSFTSWLMSPDWTSGDLFRIRTPLYNMWVTIANIVYFIYAILLILIALATILGKENFNYKAMLPRLALGLLMVPFTWWFVQWTISLSSIVTASTISIPTDILTRTEGSAWWNQAVIPKKYTIEDGNLFSSKENLKNCTESTCTSPKEFVSKGSGMYGPLVVYAYGVFNLEKVKVMSMTDLPKNITQVLNQVIMGALMLMIFGILVVALTVMLLYRAIMLWMYMVFSPLFTLHFVAGKDLLGGKLESFDIQQFIGLCFMPAVVGLVLSFGLVIVSTIQSTGTNNPNVETCDGAKIRSDAGCTIDSALKITRKVVADPEGSNNYITVSEMEISTLTVEFKGKLNVTQNIDEMAQGVNSTRNALDSAGGIFGTLILDIIAIVFIWMAFMAAKGMNKIIGAVLDPFENFGKEIGKLGTSLPKYAPLPIPGGNIAGATKIAGMGQSALDYRSQQKLDQDPLYKYLKEKAGQGGVTAERTAGDKTKFEKGNINDIKSTAQSYSAAESDALIDKVVKTTSDAARGNIIRQLSGQEKEKATELWKKVSDNNATPTEKLQLHAILAGQRWADISSKSEAALKELIDSIKKSTNNGSAQSSTENKVKLQGSKMDISINNTNIIANADSTKTAEQIATAIKAADGSTNYKNHVSKDEFISVMTTGLGGTDAAKTKATEIADKLGDNFFKTEAKTDTEATKPAEPTEPKK